MSPRRIVFWLHLFAGIVTGVVIFMLCLTGVILAFEKEIVAFADRDSFRVEVSEHRLSVEELLVKAKESHPEKKPGQLILSPAPGSVAQISYGRGDTVLIDPYSGEIRELGAPKTRAFMRFMLYLHRWLVLEGESRATGRAVTGACTVVFTFLAVSGLWLWWPRRWSWRGLKSTVWFIPKARGKTRDWNWHNTFGFWSLPLILIMCLTAHVISYQWAKDLLFHLAGETPPPPGTRPGLAPADLKITPPEAGAKKLTPDQLLALAQDAYPSWESMSLSLGGGGGGRAAGAGNGESRGARTATAPTADERQQERPTPAAPVSIRVTEGGKLPIANATQLSLHPYTGEILQAQPFSDYSTGQQLRLWARFLHTGEAVGFIGKLLALLGSLGGCVLVWTGFALTWRRFFRRGKASTPQ